MAAGLYKKGQGYWTRLMSGIGLGLIVLLGVAWLWDLLKTVHIPGIQPVYLAAGGAVVTLGVFGWLGYYLIGRKPKVVDFMVATEGEMKKVHWSTRREILGSTWVVIAMTFMIACYCFAFDRVFQFFFQWIDVLEAT